jgi:hypothetical protein
MMATEKIMIHKSQVLIKSQQNWLSRGQNNSLLDPQTY